MTRWLLLALGPVVVACGSTAGDPVKLPYTHGQATATAFTTRLPGGDPEMQAIAVTQAVYAATREENAVGAIIVTRQDAHEAFTAMQRVTHMPVNAPLLYLDPDGRLSGPTKREMRRLHPDGVVQDGKTQVYVVGAVDPSVAEEIRRDLGYSVRELRASDPIALAELLDRWQAALKSDHPDEVVIAAVDHPDGVAHGMGAMGWNAHMGKGFAWVYRDRVPDETRRILSRRFQRAYVYLTGPPEVISDAVAADLAQYGLVRRVAGADVFASNVVNAGYKDFGRNFGWWFGQVPRNFGWGIAQSGHNFIFGSADAPLHVIPAVVLGHMGKHGPVLLVRRDEVPERVADYLQMVRPEQTAPMETIANHGWIIGDESVLSWEVQKTVTRLLAPRGQLQAEARYGTGSPETLGTTGR